VFVPEVHLVALRLAATGHALFVRGAALPRIHIVLLEAASGAEHACPGAARGLFTSGDAVLSTNTSQKTSVFSDPFG
jgi:hypothetical protein